MLDLLKLASYIPRALSIIAKVTQLERVAVSGLNTLSRAVGKLGKNRNRAQKEEPVETPQQDCPMVRLARAEEQIEDLYKRLNNDQVGRDNTE